jgi:hypothetical protein
MHRRLACQFASFGPFVMRELPFFVPPIREAVQWHIASNNDAGLRWVIERIAAVAAQSNARLQQQTGAGAHGAGQQPDPAIAAVDR